MTFEEKTITKVESKSLFDGPYSYNEFPRFKEKDGNVQEHSRYSNGQRKFYFTIKSDAMRFCKSHLMKNLFDRINAAKEAIEEVKKFRSENFELLTHEWTERNIVKLEREIR